MRQLRKVLTSTILVLLVFIMFCSMSFAATVGQVLTSAENGWQRYDDTDSRILYLGAWQSTTSNSGYYNSTSHFTPDSSNSVNFKFYGSKIRIIANPNTMHTKFANISIDGVSYTYSNYGSSLTYQVLLFEKLDLSLGVHEVIVKTTDSSDVVIDAVDIDSNGRLVEYSQPQNSGILEISMTNGNIKEYDMTGTELQNFLDWYNNFSTGTGKSYYIITKKNAIKPFLSRKEYLAFDKISSFEVKEYNE